VIAGPGAGAAVRTGGGASRQLRALLAFVMVGVVGVLAACEKAEYERPDRAEQVADAEAMLTPETFDTVTWSNPQERAFAGNNVFAAKCRSCHGYLGEGDTEYAREQRVAVPSLVREDWPHDDIESARRRIFTGHPAGMPTFGVARISPREIDAAAYYIVEVLRPEVLQQR
jgi:mono/diheme cytochrome c family protein